MILDDPFMVVMKLVLAVAAGALLGSNRQRKHPYAGIRTFSLVTLGSAMFTLGSTAFTGGDVDPSRVAAQIVTGVGFLGAGIIWKHKGSLYGLTTAAGVWMSAALGIAMALGEWLLSGVGLVLALFILKLKDWMPRKYRSRNMHPDDDD